MNFTTSLLLLAFASNVLAFPITGSKTSSRHEQYKLFSSDDRIDDTPKQPANDAAEDSHTLSGLLGEMFEAKLEMSRETKQLESLRSKNIDMPVLGPDGVYRIVSQNQLE